MISTKVGRRINKRTGKSRSKDRNKKRNKNKNKYLKVEKQRSKGIHFQGAKKVRESLPSSINPKNKEVTVPAQ